MQEKLFPKMLNQTKILKNISILIESASILKIPVLFSEQYPKGLGKTIAELKVLKDSFDGFYHNNPNYGFVSRKNFFNPDPAPALVVEKTTFSCGGSKKFIKILKSLNRSQIIITGIEAHVCVLQTAIDLKGMNYHSFVVEDAISSRVKKSKDIAKKRLGNNGCDLVSTEMIVFEWIKDSGDQNFKKISRLIV
jgi:nicotinamidase-related amidase